MSDTTRIAVLGTGRIGGNLARLLAAAGHDVTVSFTRDRGALDALVCAAAESTVLEAPRRPGSVYGEEYHRADAEAVVRAVREGRPIPPTPDYSRG